MLKQLKQLHWTAGDIALYSHCSGFLDSITMIDFLYHVHQGFFTALEWSADTSDNGVNSERVWKELCYGKAKMWRDAKKAARWWWYN